MLSSPTASRISRIGAVLGRDESAPFSASFMLPVPEASVPAVEICSERSPALIRSLGDLHTVIRHEHDFQQDRAPPDRC